MFTGWEKGHLACKIQCHLFTTVFFQSNQKNKTLQNCLKFLFQQPTFWNYSKFSQEFQKDFLNNCVTFYSQIPILLPSVLWLCWLGGRKGIRPVKNLSGGVLAWLSVWSVMQTAMAQLMPLPLTVSCFSKTQIGFTFLVLAHPGNPGKRAVKRVCVCVCEREYL